MSAVVRERMSKQTATAAYRKALQILMPRNAKLIHGVREYVRCLRAEAAAWRTKAQTAEREIALLKIELEEARRGAHE